MDIDDGTSSINQPSGFGTIKESYMDEEQDSDYEEEKSGIQKNASNTRIDIDRSQFDAPSMDQNDQSYNLDDKMGGGNIYNQRMANPNGYLQNQDSASALGS